jgi:hypothetical protein
MLRLQPPHNRRRDSHRHTLFHFWKQSELKLASCVLKCGAHSTRVTFLVVRISCRPRFEERNHCTHPLKSTMTTKCADPELFAGVNELDAVALALETEGFPAAFFTLLFANSWCQ